MAKTSPGTVMLTPTVPTPLAALYSSTSAARVRGGGEALPTISHLLREAMAATLLAAGVPPSSLPPPPSPSRTSSATAARSRQRLARKIASDPTDGT